MSSSYVTERRNVDTENIFPIFPLVEKEKKEAAIVRRIVREYFLRFGFTIIGYRLLNVAAAAATEWNIR